MQMNCIFLGSYGHSAAACIVIQCLFLVFLPHHILLDITVQTIKAQLGLRASLD